jgi:sporulation protein YlmC with PRC-barrel domain
MRTKSKIMMASGVALSLALTSASRADGPATPDNTATLPQSGYTEKSTAGQAYVPPPNYYQNRPAASIAGTPAEFNRASGIIGMDVRNQNNEHLGRVKDVVFDLNSERVSYAVIATAHTGFLGMREKLVAVPLSALNTSPNEKHLILNADRSKMMAAAGFDRNNWPGVNNPSWGAEPFWQSDSDKSINTQDKSDRMTPAAEKSDNPVSPPTPTPEN